MIQTMMIIITVVLIVDDDDEEEEGCALCLNVHKQSNGICSFFLGCAVAFLVSSYNSAGHDQTLLEAVQQYQILLSRSLVRFHFGIN